MDDRSREVVSHRSANLILGYSHLRDGVGGRLRYHGLDGCRGERLKHGLDAHVIASRDQGHPAVLPDRRGGVGRSGSSWLGSHVRETHRFDRLFVDEGSMKGFKPRFRARGGFGCIRRSPQSAERIHRSTRRTAGAPRPLALSKSECHVQDDGSISARGALQVLYGEFNSRMTRPANLRFCLSKRHRRLRIPSH